MLHLDARIHLDKVDRPILIHQELNLAENLDVAGNVFLGREPLWGGPLRLVDRAKMERETQPYLDQLGLPVSSTTPLAQLSLAQQQMLAPQPIPIPVTRAHLAAERLSPGFIEYMNNWKGFVAADEAAEAAA